MTSRLAALVAALSLGGAHAAAAQSVSDALTFLLTNQGVQTGSVERDREAALATSNTISRGLVVNLATLPVPSSSTAFLYRLNPELGTVERASESFGPFFIERALTAGRGQISFGFTVQQFHFTSLDGRELRDGSLITTANQFVDESEPFDVDRLTLDLDANVTTFYGNVGVTNRVEVGFAVPLVSLFLDGSRENVYRGQRFTQATARARATGLADVLVRTKVKVYEEEGAALAGAVDVRLPTGSTDDLLGAGSSSIRFAGIGSIEGQHLSGHVNLGYTFGGLADEVSFGGAVAVAATPRLSIIAEALGRSIDSPGGIVPIAAAHPTLRDVQTIRLAPGRSRLNIISVAPGIKWNIADTWVLSANVGMPLTNTALAAPFTPFIGLDFALGR